MLSRLLAACAALVLLTSVHAAEPPCSRDTPVNARCEIRVADLHPTQSAIGLIQVEERVARLRGQPQAVASMARRALPVVQAPDGAFYLTDGHHQASTLQRLGVPSATAQLIGRFNDAAAFWQEMQTRHWVYLHDAHGKPITPAQLPKHIADLGDDPYRSLAGYAEDAGFIRRTDVYFMEFEWARYLGAHMEWQPVDRLNLLWALQAAERLACNPAARELPGYAGPCGAR